MNKLFKVKTINQFNIGDAVVFLSEELKIREGVIAQISYNKRTESCRYTVIAARELKEVNTHNRDLSEEIEYELEDRSSPWCELAFNQNQIFFSKKELINHINKK